MEITRAFYTARRDLLNRIRSDPKQNVFQSCFRPLRFDLEHRACQHWIMQLFEGVRHERIHLAFLNAREHLICDQLLAHGDSQHVSGNIPEITSRSARLSASSVVIMHNHPSGNPLPSPLDIEETRRLETILLRYGIKIHDHIIIARNKIFSMRKARLMSETNEGRNVCDQ